LHCSLLLEKLSNANKGSNNDPRPPNFMLYTVENPVSGSELMDNSPRSNDCHCNDGSLPA
ncbi:MAG: hypothetical protein QGI86_28330, partial [Candidatus Poribacteria bacterium]|nr:hypothetical protein [Candidatus Poribacteria bacterium]